MFTIHLLTSVAADYRDDAPRRKRHFRASLGAIREMRTDSLVPSVSALLALLQIRFAKEHCRPGVARALDSAATQPSRHR